MRKLVAIAAGLVLIWPLLARAQQFGPETASPSATRGGPSTWGGISVPQEATRLPVSTPSMTSTRAGTSPGFPAPPPPSTPGRLASQSLPQYLAEPVDEYTEQVGRQLVEPKRGPPGGRAGIFQRLSVSGTWLPQPSGSDVGLSDLDLSVLLGFPMPTRESPLLIRPRFAVHYVDGPITPDLPSRLYDAEIEWRHMRKLTELWAADVSVTTGYYSDLASDQGEAFRVTGRGLGIYDWSPMTKVILGVVYLNRPDLSLLPAGGLLITPNDTVRWELIMPRPRVAWRVDGCQVPDDEKWLYLAGEFGSGVWAIERSSGADDRVTLRDYRAILGFERKREGGIGHRVEIGYVFGRELEYDSATPDFEADDTLMLRYAARY